MFTLYREILEGFSYFKRKIVSESALQISDRIDPPSQFCLNLREIGIYGYSTDS